MLKRKNDLELLNLKGKVKKFQQIIFDPIVNNNIILKGKKQICPDNKYISFSSTGFKTEERKLLPSFNSEWKEIFFYDNNDHLIESLVLDSKGAIQNKWLFKYDNCGNIIETNNINPTLAPVSDSVHYSYDDNGNVIEKRCLSPFGKYIYYYKYDCQNNLKEEYKCNINGKLEWRHIYQVIDKKKVIGEFDDKEKYSFQWIYLYDDYGNVIRENFKDYLERLEATIVYKYDSAGNIISQYFYESDLILLYTWTYQYDKQGNWIWCAKYEKGIPVSVTERFFDYY